MPDYENCLEFDRDDIVGIALCSDDPMFLDQVHFNALKEHVIDESGVDGSFTTAIDKQVEIEAPEDIDLDLSSIESEEDDVSIDGMDVEDLASYDSDIESGIADTDIDLLDYIELEEM